MVSGLSLSHSVETFDAVTLVLSGPHSLLARQLAGQRLFPVGLLDLLLSKLLTQ